MKLGQTPYVCGGEIVRLPVNLELGLKESSEKLQR